ncbi:MAG: hypothetical protein ACRDRP_15715 [Pseudonocardiaceae bacterium]
MAHQLTPPSGREDEGHPRFQADRSSALAGCFDADLNLPGDLGVRPGESDPGRMLGWVLLIVVVTVVVAMLALVWWLI